MREIASVDNPTIKFLQRLQRKASNRHDAGLCVVEGKKEIQAAIAGGFAMHSLYVCPQLYSKQLPAIVQNPQIYSISLKLFEKLAYRGSSDGLLAIFQTKHWQLDNLPLTKSPLLLVAEAIEKPGNLGALLRIADGCGADAVIVCDQHTDVYNPNVIRASVGCVFQKPIAVCTNKAFLDFCQTRGITCFAAALRNNAQVYTSPDFTKPTAFVLGTEATGLSDFWLQSDHATPIIIPMHGYNDSLNVATAAAVLAYEAARQRA